MRERIWYGADLSISATIGDLYFETASLRVRERAKQLRDRIIRRSKMNEEVLAESFRWPSA